MGELSKKSRREIADLFVVDDYAFAGNLTDADFVARIYDLDEVKSNDYRYPHAHRDILQHREYNKDWADDWVFTDPRFNVINKSGVIDGTCHLRQPKVPVMCCGGKFAIVCGCFAVFMGVLRAWFLPEMMVCFDSWSSRNFFDFVVQSPIRRSNEPDSGENLLGTGRSALPEG